MPYGLTNALTIAMKLMDRVFRPHLINFMVMSIHDISVYSKDISKSTTNLMTVIPTLREHDLYGKLKK